MNEVVRQTLAKIIARHARPPALDVRRCEGLLRDYLRGEHKREINVLVSALREQVVADLLASGSTMPTAVLLTRCARKLHDQTGIAEDLALWSVESWALALGVIVQDSNITTDKTLPTSSVSTEQKSGLYVNCSCGKRARVPEAAYGRRVRCPSCRRTFTAPKPESPLAHANDKEPLPGALAPTDPLPESQPSLNSWGILPPLARLAPTDSIPESQPSVSPHQLYPAGLGVFVAAPPDKPYPVSSPPSPPDQAVPSDSGTPIPSRIESPKEVEEKQPAVQSHSAAARTNEEGEELEKSAEFLRCTECGVSKALARCWYSTSPITGKRKHGIGWCDYCYEKLYARNIRPKVR